MIDGNDYQEFSKQFNPESISPILLIIEFSNLHDQKNNWPPGYGLKKKKQNVYKAVGLSSILLFQHLQQTRTPQMRATAKKNKLYTSEEDYRQHT